MTREALEHIIRAAATIADDDELVVIGSQSILGQFPRAPGALLVSDEADVYPLHFPERAELIDGSIGELSPFHETFGYYAQGVGPETAVLPAGWRERLVPIRADAIRHGLVDRAVLEARAATLPIDAARRETIASLIARDHREPC